MATGLSLAGTGNLDTGQKILVANARFAYEPAAPDPDLIESIRLPQGHKQWDVLWWNRLATANALTEGVDLGQYEQLVTSTYTITPTEHGTLTNVSKRLVRSQGDANVMAAVGQMLAGNLRRRQALDVIALYDGASKSTPGASLGIDLTHFRGTVSYLLTDNDSQWGPAPMPLRAALHIEQISDIVLDITDPGSVSSSRFGLSAEMLQRWWRGSDRAYGVELFHSGNISRDSSGDSKGAIFARTAMTMVIAEDAEPVQQRDISLRASEVGLFQEWSEAETADAHMVEVYSDTSSTL
jgi:hypothetical protein